MARFSHGKGSWKVFMAIGGIRGRGSGSWKAFMFFGPDISCVTAAQGGTVDHSIQHIIACLRRIWVGWVSCSLFPT